MESAIKSAGLQTKTTASPLRFSQKDVSTCGTSEKMRGKRRSPKHLRSPSTISSVNGNTDGLQQDSGWANEAWFAYGMTLPHGIAMGLSRASWPLRDKKMGMTRYEACRVIPS